MISANSFAYCKINQFGHNLCKGEKALLVVDPSDNSKSSDNLIKQYKPVIIRSLHVHEPIAEISGKGVKTQKVHVDQLLGNKLCKDSDFCHGQKVIIKDECRVEDEEKSYSVSKVYEDQQLTEDIIEVSRGRFVFKKTKIFNQSCILDRD
jgi:hypothetical protein